jgi:hypothetical protein
MTTYTKDNLYLGSPGAGGRRVSVEDRDGNVRTLVHHPRHSPDGHSWGYNGSGPADLAKDLLWDHMGVEPSPVLYQAFKEAVVATVPMNAPFEIDSATITKWLLEWRSVNPDEPLGVDGL